MTALVTWALIASVALTCLLVVLVFGALLIGLVVRIVRALGGREHAAAGLAVEAVVRPAGPDVRADLSPALRRASR